MIRMKTFADGIFVNDEERFEFAGFRRDTREINKPFAQKDGRGWALLRLLLDILFSLSHLVLAVVFLCFFINALAFGATCLFYVTLEMVDPVFGGTASQRYIVSVCTAVMLYCILVMVCLTLSLFWEVLKAVLFKNTLNVNVLRMVVVFLILVAAGIWTGSKVPPSKSSVSFTSFIEHAIIISWLFAFVISLLGSATLIAFVYTGKRKSKKVLYTMMVMASVLVIFAVMSVIIFIVIVESSKGAIAFVFLLLFTTAVLKIYIYFRGMDIERKKFIINWGIVVLVVALYLAGITLFGSAVTQLKCDTRCKENLLDNAWTATNQATPSPNASSPYPICGKTWSTSKLNIADMALLTNLTYNAAVFGNNATAKDIAVNQYFSGRGITWSVVSTSNKAPYFYHIRGTNNVHIIGVRGAKDSEELIGAVKMWNEIAVLQCLSMIFPIVHALPMEFIAEYVDNSAFLDKLFHHGSTRYFFQSLEDYVVGVATANEEVFLVGHSLGGGIAKIIAARQKVHAVTFSSPGIGYSYKKFDFSLKNAARYTTTIRPDKDVIPSIDRLYGEVQHITCNGEHFMACHSISRTYCELRTGCHFSGLPRCPSML